MKSNVATVLEPQRAPAREQAVRVVRPMGARSTSYPPVPESTIDALADLVIAHLKKHPDLKP